MALTLSLMREVRPSRWRSTRLLLWNSFRLLRMKWGGPSVRSRSRAFCHARNQVRARARASSPLTTPIIDLGSVREILPWLVRAMMGGRVNLDPHPRKRRREQECLREAPMLVMLAEVPRCGADCVGRVRLWVVRFERSGRVRCDATSATRSVDDERVE
jgi:hypothetical protein